MSRAMLLGELIARAKVRRAGDASLPILSMTMESGLVDQSDKFKKRIASADTAPYKRVARGQLVVGFPIDEGVLSFQTLYDEAIVSPAYDVWDVRRPDLVDRRYLERVLRGPKALAYYRARLQSTTARRRTLPEEVFLNFQVWLPSLEQQAKAVALFETADGLHSKRQEAIRLADELLKATFFDQIGDPVVNPRGWSERCISEIGIVTTGNTPDRSIDANFGNAIEWIKSDNINTPSHWLTKAREGLSTKGMERARIVSEGATLMTCIAGSPSCIGNVAMADRRVAFNQQINAITPKDDIDPKFLYLLLLFSKARIQATSTNSMKGMVSKGTLEKVRLIWPPKSLQDQLVQVFDRVAKLQARMEETQQLNLYESLQAQLLA